MEYYKHFISGTFAGIAGTIVSHPFFTLKTYLQNGEQVLYNMKFLYRGVSPAIVGYSIEKTLVFGSYKNINNLLKGQMPEKLNSFISGFLAGIIASFSITFFEQMTINMQRNLHVNNFKNLYKGFLPTMARESIGFSIYFSVYDHLKNKYNKQSSLYITALIGIPSIVTAWSIITPIDKIKTNIQSNIKVDIHNITSAYRSFPYVMLRAVPFHTTCFVVYEYVQSLFG